MAQVSVYMSLDDQRTGLFAYKPTLDRLGVSVSAIPIATTSVLPLFDISATKLADHPMYMPKSSLDKILNKDRLGETGLLALPATVIEKPEDAPAGTIAKVRNTAVGGWVYQPHMGFPVEDLDVHFTVNANSDIHVIAVQRHEHLGLKKPARLRMARPDEYVGVVEQISEACKRLQIRGGIHDVQFLFHEGTWQVIDWNPRAPYVYTEGLANTYPCLDAALAHMVGLPVSDAPPAIFVNRSYWDAPIPIGKRSLIASFGLVPRTDIKKTVEGFVRVNGVGASESEVNAKFNLMESSL